MAAPDLKEFERLQRRPGPRCKIGIALEQLDDAGQLQAALDAAHIQGQAIRRWLLARGVRVGDDAVGRHRRGECSCG